MYYYRRMSNYKISSETYEIAKKMHLKIMPSSNAKKKIDVITHEGKKISIGDINYDDYHTYQRISKEKAEERKRLYHIRNHKHAQIKYTPAYYAAILLW